MKGFRQAFRDLVLCRNMPGASVNLMLSRSGQNDPFYATLAQSFYRDANRRHRKFPLVRRLEYVAICQLPDDIADYFMMIEASGRRNVRKARRFGYSCRLIHFNAELEDIGKIRQSTDTRQGELTGYMAEAYVEPCSNPASTDPTHDYVYYGVFQSDTMVAYGGCLICGELCMVEHILGHAKFLAHGVVPMLIVEMIENIVRQHPQVKFYAYGTYFGAGSTMRRFKRKFGFAPHRVSWERG